MGSTGFGAYGAGLFEHRHVALGVAPAEVRRVCNLVENQCMVEIPRGALWPEPRGLLIRLRFHFLACRLRTSLLRNSVVRLV